MAKDPAFLFYPNDFDAATKFFTDEQVGKYLRILISQFQHGRLSEQKLRIICKTYDEDVISKLNKDEQGLYYSDRLEHEIEKRRVYTESRRNNRKKKVFTEHMKNISSSYVEHMENENENENSNVNIPKTKKEKLPKIIEHTIFDDYLETNCPTVRKLKIQMTAQQAENLEKEFGRQAVQEIFDAMENWIPLSKKSKSVYLTAKTWLSKRTTTTTTTHGKSKPTFTQGISDWLNQVS